MLLDIKIIDNAIWDGIIMTENSVVSKQDEHEKPVFEVFFEL